MDSEIDHNPDDAYAEDDLPDLVLDTRKDSSSSLEGQEDSNSSSVIDLLFNLSRERRSVSSSDVANWIDAGNDEIDNFDTEQVRILILLNSRLFWPLKPLRQTYKPQRRRAKTTQPLMNKISLLISNIS